MPTVNVFEAKSTLSKLLDAVESGRESEIIIARYGRPVARLLPITRPNARSRIGVAETKHDFLPDDSELDAAVLELFTGQKVKPRRKTSKVHP